MTNSTKSRKLSPISVRVTLEERRVLEMAAKGASLSEYIRRRLFSSLDIPDAGMKKSARLSPQARQQMLAQILSELGHSSIAQSLADMAYAAKIGVLPVTSDVVSEIRSACVHVKDMRSALLRSLGLRGGNKK